MFLSTDITSFIDSFVALLFNGVVDCFSILDSITFHNISLLDFCIGILLLGTILPIIINFASTGVSSSRGYLASETRKADYRKMRKGG